MYVHPQVYYTEQMPKTATGKVQRRLVAQSMTERESQKETVADNNESPPAITSEKETSIDENILPYDKKKKVLQRDSLWRRILKVFR